ncbi:MAG: ATP-binding protein [Ghiorsea sp.]|nr:ATP-binding protein [Ghiorsea sp.]
MYNSLFRTFRGRLAMSYVIVEFLILAFAAVLIYWFLSNQIYQEVDDALFEEANVLVENLEHAPQQEWGKHLQDFTIYYRGVVQLVSPKGTILFSVGEELVGHDKQDVAHAIREALAGNAAVFVSTRGLLRKNNLRVAVMPIHIRGQIVAVAILARTTDDIQRFFKLLYTIGGILGLLSMLISGLIGYRMARRSLRPINEITRAAQAVANGDLSRRLKTSVHDEEIHTLVESLNKMFESLEANFNSHKRFVSDTSHELRHPITILKGEIEVALLQERSPEEYRALLKKLFSISTRMQHIVNDMLTLAQADAGTLEIPQEPVDLSLLLQEVGQDHLMLFSKRKIHLEMNIQEGLEMIGDQHRIERVFYNLLNNAFRYAPENSTITLSATAVDEYAIIQVLDEGEGVAQKDIPHLFERFFRADDARTNQQGEGAGLGLAICKHIVLAHQGEIHVLIDDRQGATFEVKLPLASVNPDHAKPLQGVLVNRL